MNVIALQFQTIVESLDREKTILAFSNQDRTFHTFGKGEKLNPKVYEFNKDQINLKIYEFIQCNRAFLNPEGLKKLESHLGNQIKKLTVKISGKNNNLFNRLKRIFIVFFSIFPLVPKPSNGEKEKAEKLLLDKIMIIIKSNGLVDLFAPNEPTIPQILAPADQVNQAQSAPFLDYALDQAIIANPDLPVDAPSRPIPPPPLFMAPKTTMLVDESLPPADIKPSGYRLLSQDQLLDQINRIDDYIQASTPILESYKVLIEEVKGVRENLKVEKEKLKTSQEILADCESKFRFLSFTCENKRIATFNIQGRIVLPPFQMYPLEIYNEIAERINPQYVLENPDWLDISSDISHSEDDHDMVEDDVIKAPGLFAPKTLPKCSSGTLTITIPGSSSDISNEDTTTLPIFDNGFPSDDAQGIIDKEECIKMFQKHLAPQPANNEPLLPKINPPAILKDIALSVSEKHLKILEKHILGIKEEVLMYQATVSALEEELDEKEKWEFNVFEQTGETSEEVAYTVNQMEALLVTKVNNLNAWLRHKNVRVQELEKREKKQSNNVPAPPPSVNGIPEDIVAKYKQLLDTANMPQNIAILLTSIKNANSDEDQSPTLKYFYSLYTKLITPDQQPSA